MNIRESGLFAGLAWAMSAWASGFALTTLFTADRLTSPQWRALMTIPGGKFFWVTLFGAAAIILIAGLLTHHYKSRGTGLALIGVGCFGIAVFYLVAPLFHLGPITLGYWPWFLGVGLGTFGAIANWWPIEWF